MDLGDLGGKDETGDFEKFLGARSPGIGSGARVPPDRADPNRRWGPGRSFTVKFVDKQVVLAREDVMKKTQADVPIIRKSRRLLAGPLRILRIRLLQYRQIARLHLRAT